MSEENKLSDLNDLMLEKMGELIDLRSNTWKWVSAAHTAKDTEARLNEVRILSDELSRIARSLVDHKKAVPADGAETENLLKRFDLLHDYERDIQECLTSDLATKKKERSDTNIDYVKNVTFIFGLPIAFVTSVKNGVGHGSIDVDQALLVGFAISIPTVFHKSVKSLFSQAAKSVCAIPATLYAVPASIRNDMRVYYAKEIIRQKAKGARACFAASAKSVNDNVQATRTRMKAGLKRLWRRSDPRL